MGAPTISFGSAMAQKSGPRNICIQAVGQPRSPKDGPVLPLPADVLPPPPLLDCKNSPTPKKVRLSQKTALSPMAERDGFVFGFDKTLGAQGRLNVKRAPRKK